MTDSTESFGPVEACVGAADPTFPVWIAALEDAQRRAENPAMGDEEYSPAVRKVLASADRCLLLQKQVYDMPGRAAGQ